MEPFARDCRVERLGQFAGRHYRARLAQGTGQPAGNPRLAYFGARTGHDDQSHNALPQTENRSRASAPKARSTATTIRAGPKSCKPRCWKMPPKMAEIAEPPKPAAPICQPITCRAISSPTAMA